MHFAPPCARLSRAYLLAVPGVGFRGHAGDDLPHLWGPINHDDWVRTAADPLFVAWRESVPRSVLRWSDHRSRPGRIWCISRHDPVFALVAVFFGVFHYATARLVVALNVAFWSVIILTAGCPALVLVLHPTFDVMGLSQYRLSINGVGLWLILRGARGRRRGVALLLIAIKPCGAPLVLMLEGARTLCETGKLLTMASVTLISIPLYPTWLTETLRTYFGALDGSGAATETRTLSGYSFSVLERVCCPRWPSQPRC